MGADETVSTLERIGERRGRVPALIRCDNVAVHHVDREVRDLVADEPCPAGEGDPLVVG